MTGQMNIYDILYPGRINPIREVAKMASPSWKDAGAKIRKYQDSDIKDLAKIIRHQYCPYGCAGHYGTGNGPNTLQGYDMRSDLIWVEWYDEEDKKQRRAYSWEDFAREVMDMIWANEYQY